jgi:hypothetical protein
VAAACKRCSQAEAQEAPARCVDDPPPPPRYRSEAVWLFQHASLARFPVDLEAIELLAAIEDMRALVVRAWAWLCPGEGHCLRA